MEEKTKRYKVTSGKHHVNCHEKTGDGNRLKAKHVTFQIGGVFDAYPSRMKAFLDKCVCLDGSEVPELEPPVNDRVGFKKNHIGGGRYEVINLVNGVRINDENLSKEEADALINSKVKDNDGEDDGE